MIKVDKWKVAIIGTGDVVFREFRVIVTALADSLKKSGVPVNEAKEQLIELVNAAFEDDSKEDGTAADTGEKDPMDEVEELLGKIFETLKEVHK